ncbi:MAG TPA: M1 family aminopeptidase [Catalimonadaceae bacterium]|nr:M1 family aminopeptidase [Catalimonadaceae bacterium]
MITSKVPTCFRTVSLCFCLLVSLNLSGPVAAQSGFSLSQLAEKEAILNSNRFAPAQIMAAANGTNIDVRYYSCHWLINPQNDSIRGKVAIVFTPKSSAVSNFTLDMASNLVVESAIFKGVTVTTSTGANATLNVDLGAQSLQPGQTDSLVIRYKGRPVSSVFGSYSRVLHDGVPVIYTLSEPYGAKDWWPCKQALSDKADSVDITVYTPSPNFAVSNGLLKSQTESNGVRTFRWKHKYPVATYLIAIAVTNFTHFRLKAVLSSGDTLPIDNYCYPEHLANWQAGMPAITGIMQDFDTLFAPYPFAREKYGHCEFAFGGGMEHQTISFMQNTDIGLQAHELAHHWFGNKITCHSWQDIWLNEGFATYMAAMEYVKVGLSDWPREGQQWINLITSEPGGSVFCTDTTDLYRIFSGRLSYGKGAMLLRMLHWKLGDQAFWNGIRNYIQSPELAYGFVKTPDFITKMEQASGQNLTEFFNDWYKGQGYPNYQVNATLLTDQIKFQMFQTSSHPSVSFFEMPVPVRVYGGSHDTLIILNHQQSGQEFTFPLSFVPDSIKVDPDREILAKSSVVYVVTSAKPLISHSTISIQPNPFSEKLAVGGFQKKGQIVIMDAMGKEIQTIEHDLSAVSVSFQHLPSGLYLMRTENEDGQKTHRILHK